MTKDTQKIKLLVLYQLLLQNTDEDHQLSTEEIISAMHEKGIDLCGRVLARDVSVLNEYGFEIETMRRKSNYYYVTDRRFEMAELRVLIDAVQAAKFIPATQTERLVDKIAAVAGKHKCEVLKRDTVQFEIKHSNRVVLYSIDTIQSAMEYGKKVSFLYFDWLPDGKRYRKSGKRYSVDPVGLFYANENYYLNCYTTGHDELANYRVDRMDTVEIEEAVSEHAGETTECVESKGRTFGQFLGKTIRVQLRVQDIAFNGIVDKFGHEVEYKRENESEVSVFVTVQISDMFFSWIAASRGKVSIYFPKTVKTQYLQFIEEISKKV